jgi:hypothetical protein
MRGSKAAVLFLMLVLVSGVIRSAPVTISNPSFETAALTLSGNGPYSNLIAGSTIASTSGTLANWTASATTTAAAAGGFAPTIGGVNWSSKWWTGSNIAYLQLNAAGSATLSQTLSDTLQNNTTYTLTAKVGKRSFGVSFNYSLQLWAGSTLLSSTSGLPLVNNTFAMDRLVYNSGAGNPGAGQPLMIVLSSTWTGSFTEAFFDDVSLIGAPTSAATLNSSPSTSAQFGQPVTLTATVNPSSATGTMTFFDNETVLGIATLAGGQASLSTTLLRAGQRSLKAYYSGDLATGAGNSTPIPFSVNAAVNLGFAPAVTYATLQGPSDLAIGDFNADGKADLAAVDYSASKVSILLGAGNGTFAAHVDYDAGAGPVGIATGDFNGDGKTDLVIADNNGSALRVLFGSGTGTFGSPLSLPVGSAPQGVAVGDLNLDGKADIVAANSGSNSVSVFLGNGDGSFQTVTYPLGGSGPRGVAIGDFNGDGIPDLAVAMNGTGAIYVLLGNGNGTFQTITGFNAASPFYVTVADVNGDGKEDLLASSLNLSAGTGNTVSVLLGNGNGTFQSYKSYTNGLASPGSGIRGLTVGDFNADGLPDVVLANWGAAVVSLLLNNGDGTFGSLATIPVGQGPADVAVGDFNGDGSPDIAAALFNGGSQASVSLVLGTPPPPNPDLVPLNIKLSSSSVRSGASFSVNWTLVNAGGVAANAASTTVVRINQSTTSSAGTDLATIGTPALAAGTSVAQSATLTAPTTPGIYYVWVVADASGAVANQITSNDSQRSGVLRSSGPSEIWFAPLDDVTRSDNVIFGIIPPNFGGSTDYMSLFSANAAWTQAENRTAVFKMYQPPFGGGPQLPAFTDNQLQQIFTFLNQHNIALAVELGPLIPTVSCGNGVEGFTGQAAQSLATRIKNNGGTLAYLAMDEPFYFANIYNGSGACQWTASQIATNALTSIGILKTAFPDLQIGDIEPVPPNGLAADWIQRYATWMDAFQTAVGSKLAFFHADTGFLPTWITDVAALRVETSKRGISLGISYDGFPSDTSDAQWLGRAQQNFVDFELAKGQPDQALFQSWEAFPRTHLPETTPYTFTWMLDQYARPRPSLTLNTTLTQASGKLLDNLGAPVASAPITVTLRPISGPGVVADYTLTGIVPAGATGALVGIRINEECGGCSGTADVAMYTFQYSETGAGSRTANLDFANGFNGWGLFDTGTSQFESTPIPPGQDLHVTAQPGQVVQLNSSTFTATPGAAYTLHIKARVSPQSAGTGYFTIIFVGSQEVRRDNLNLQSGIVTLGTAQTGSDGSYNLQFAAQPGDPQQLQTQADYPGIDYPLANARWPARAIAQYGARRGRNQLTSQ